jgi:aconitase A
MNNESISTTKEEAKKLSTIVHVMCGWPLALVFIGGAIGGGLGGIAYGINMVIYKSHMPVAAKVVLPLTFMNGQNATSLGLTGKEIFDIEGLETGAKEVTVVARPESGDPIIFKATVRVDTPKEWEYYNNGGILHYVLRQLAA